MNNLDYAQQQLDAEHGEFYKPGTSHGPIKCTGPNAEADMRKFEARQARLKQVGTWRAVDAAWAHDDGDYVDVDYYLVDWDYLI